jgi:hypothetical protein
VESKIEVFIVGSEEDDKTTTRTTQSLGTGDGQKRLEHRKRYDIDSRLERKYRRLQTESSLWTSKPG